MSDEKFCCGCSISALLAQPPLSYTQPHSHPATPILYIMSKSLLLRDTHSPRINSHLISLDRNFLLRCHQRDQYSLPKASAFLSLITCFNFLTPKMPSSSSVRVNAGSSIGLNFAHEESYQHDPLDTTKQQIRLLKVIRENDSPIRCVISTSDIDTAPEYRALSYTWGSREPGFYVLVQGKRLEIRPNLAKFLQNIRREKQEYLWIDKFA